jgi:hypothetical protein
MKGAVAAVLIAACGNSFMPDHHLLGTWHVTFGPLSKGELLPSGFNVQLNATQKGYTAAIPDLTWNEPAAGIGAVFDSAPAVAVEGLTILFRLSVGSTNHDNCAVVLFGGQRVDIDTDSIPAGTVDVYNPALDTTAACFSRGGAVLVKQ